jgi:hypothetical protein
MQKFIVMTRWEGSTAYLVEAENAEDAADIAPCSYLEMHGLSQWDNEEAVRIVEVKKDEKHGDNWLRVKQGGGFK